MATILKQNKTTGNVIQQPGSNPSAPSVGGSGQPLNKAPNSSGNFTNVTNYLNANKDAGSRLGGTIGKNISTDVKNKVTGAQGSLTESNTANTNLGKVGEQATGFNQQLNTAVEPQPVQTPTTPSYDVNKYQVNNAGLAQAQDIAKNNLTQFRDIASGNAAAAAQNAARTAATKAQQSVQGAQQTFTDKQNALASEAGRFGLLKDYLGNKEYRRGLQSLDQSFLAQDKNNTLGKVGQDLKQKYDPTLRRLGVDQTTTADQIAGLGTAATDATKVLNDRLKAMQGEYNAALDTRVADVNAGKDIRNAYLNSQLETLKSGGEIDQDFYNELGLNQANKYDPNQYLNASSLSGKTAVGVNPYVSLFNTLDNKDNLDQILNRSTLNTRAQSANDVLNQRDIDNRNMLAQLMGQDPITNQQLSQFIGSQTKDSILPGEINSALTQFDTDMTNNAFKGSVQNGSASNPNLLRATADSLQTMQIMDELNKRGITEEQLKTLSQGYVNPVGQLSNQNADLFRQIQMTGNTGGYNAGLINDGNTDPGMVLAMNRLKSLLSANTNLTNTGYKNQVKVKQ